MRTTKITTFITAPLVALLTLALVVPGVAQDVGEADLTGSWEISVEGPQGPRTMTLKLIQNGAELIGTLGSERGTSDIEEGIVDGSAFSFGVTMARGERSFTLTYRGTVDGETMKGTMITPRGESPFTGKLTQG